MAASISKRQSKEPVLARSARLRVDHILRDENQPRKNFDPVKYEETKASVKAIGLQVPITVNPGPLRGGVQYYYVKYGENRWRIHKDLGLEEIDCMIDPRPYNGKVDVLRIITQAAENINRIDHTHSEIASVYKLYYEEQKRNEPKKKVGDIQTEFAAIFGKSLVWVMNYAAMANLRQEFLMRVDNKGPTQIPFQAAVALGRNPKERQTSILHGAETMAGERRDMLYRYVLHGTHQVKRARGEKVGHRVAATKLSLIRIPANLRGVLDHFGAGMGALDRQAYVRETMEQLTPEELEGMTSDLDEVISSIEALRGKVEDGLEAVTTAKANAPLFPPTSVTSENEAEEDDTSPGGVVSTTPTTSTDSTRPPWPASFGRSEETGSSQGYERRVIKGRHY